MKNTIYISLFLFIFISINSFAQDTTKLNIPDTTDFSTMSLEDLIKLKSSYKSTELEKLINQSIEVASKKPLSLKKSPSIISVITSEEIQKSGARDLIDVLSMVPGIQFNVDVQGSVGISIRGLWAQEGKILVLLDGQEMNETAFGSPQFGQHYPIDQIKKIEIIRGPGSASYGGFAEYAVINIITKSGEDLNGIQISSTVGQTANTYARQNLNFAIGHKKNDFKYSLSVFGNRGQRSNRDYTDIYSNSYSMVGNSDLNALNVNLGLQYKSFSFRFIKDNLYTTQRDQYDQILSKAYSQNFIANHFELKFQKQLTKKFNLQVKSNYKNGLPWNMPNEMDSVDGEYKYTIKTNRYRTNIVGIWDINRSVNMTIGIEGYLDEASKSGNEYFRNDSIQYVSYFNYAPFVQGLFKTRFANVTAGLRFDQNSAFGNAFSPRIGITKKIGAFNLKALYAKSFRAPSIENIQLSFDSIIKPEKSETFEFEIGYQFKRNMFFTLNIFNINTLNSLQYLYISNSVTNTVHEGYKNSKTKIENIGLEFEYKYKSNFGFVTLTYSNYNAIKNTNLIINNSTVGIANHKISLLSSINIGKHLFVSPSLTYLGNRYGYTAFDADGNGVISKYPEQVQMNLTLGCTDLVKNLNFSFGVYNLSNQRIIFIQPYDGFHNPLPGIGREFVFKLNYILQSKNEI
jgi:outer membrane receptor for ferrienterochelin and colicin